MKQRYTSLLAALALVLSLPLAAQAQDFQWAVGARVGFPFAFSAKYFLNESDAVEGILGFSPYSGYGSTSVAGAWQRHIDLDLDEIDGLRWYAGAGASIHFWNYRNNFLRDLDGERYASTSLGVSGYLGLQYVFEDLPVEVTVDWRPTILLGNTLRSAFGAGYGGVALRYTLGR